MITQTTSTNPWHRTFVISDPDEPGPHDNGAEFTRLDGAFSGTYSAAYTALNYALHNESEQEITAGGDGAYCADFYRKPNNGGVKTAGQGVGAQGFGGGDQDGGGLSGVGGSTTEGVNVFGTAGGATAGPGGAATGLYGSVIGTEHVHTKVKWESASLLLDAKTGKPLQIGRDELGRRVWLVMSDGALTMAAPFGMMPVRMKLGNSTGDDLFIECNGRLGKVQVKWL